MEREISSFLTLTILSVEESYPSPVVPVRVLTEVHPHVERVAGLLIVERPRQRCLSLAIDCVSIRILFHRDRAYRSRPQKNRPKPTLKDMDKNTRALDEARRVLYAAEAKVEENDTDAAEQLSTIADRWIEVHDRQETTRRPFGFSTATEEEWNEDDWRQGEPLGV